VASPSLPLIDNVHGFQLDVEVFHFSSYAAFTSILSTYELHLNVYICPCTVPMADGACRLNW
jgi:hypothetical protein